jgi:3-hydroxybutyryl-CoA dehydrogenase
VNDIDRVGVIGCGLMGAGVAEVCASAGLDVRVVVPAERSVLAGRKRVTDSLDRLVGKGKLSQDDRDLALDRISFGTDMTALADRQLVVEAVTEHEATKLKVFGLLDTVLTDHEAIMATNTSSLPIMRLAQATSRPGQVIGTHFFNPVPVLSLVEVTGSLLTTEETVDRTEVFLTKRLGKEVIRSHDRAGFVVNALLVPYLLAAVRMVESGYASAEDIDKGMTLGCAHPIGPLRLVDLVGLDTLVSVASGLYEEFKEPLYSPPPLLSRMAAGGLLGKKSGRGFFTYPQN